MKVGFLSPSAVDAAASQGSLGSLLSASEEECVRGAGLGMLLTSPPSTLGGALRARHFQVGETQRRSTWKMRRW